MFLFSQRRQHHNKRSAFLCSLFSTASYPIEPATTKTDKMRPGLCFAVVASLLLVDSSFGWSSPPPQQSKTQSVTWTDSTAASVTTTRREALNTAALGLLGSMSVMIASPEAARADVTNKVASAAAIRNLKRAQSQLPKLRTTVQDNDFVAVKAFLRTPPFDEVRKNGFIIVRGGEDGPKAGELQTSYKNFIASVEKIDSSASLGMRGRKVPPLQMSEEYDNVLAAMESFVKVSRVQLERLEVVLFLSRLVVSFPHVSSLGFLFGDHSWRKKPQRFQCNILNNGENQLD